MPSDMCILCGTLDVLGYYKYVVHMLDGTFREGDMCEVCFMRANVGYRYCTNCLDERTRCVYVLAPGEDYTWVMPHICPIHDTPEQSLAFMLWWARYREEHRDGR